MTNSILSPEDSQIPAFVRVTHFLDSQLATQPRTRGVHRKKRFEESPSLHLAKDLLACKVVTWPRMYCKRILVQGSSKHTPYLTP